MVDISILFMGHGGYFAPQTELGGPASQRADSKVRSVRASWSRRAMRTSDYRQRSAVGIHQIHGSLIRRGEGWGENSGYKHCIFFWLGYKPCNYGHISTYNWKLHFQVGKIMSQRILGYLIFRQSHVAKDTRWVYFTVVAGYNPMDISIYKPQLGWHVYYWWV